MTAPTSAAPRPTLLGALFDAVLDTTVVSLAVWTLLYSLGLPTQWSLHPSGWLWLLLTLGYLGYELWRVRGLLRGDGPTGEPAADARPVLGERREQLLLGLGVLLVLGAGAGALVWDGGAFRAAWAALALGLVLLSLWAWLSGQVAAPGPVEVTAAETPARGSRWLTPSEGGVAGLSVALGVLASFLWLPDTDDPYYVNRSVWVAEHGNAATQDTMFSPEVFNSPYGGGVPISSVESLFGVVAHMTGTLAGTVTWLVVPPIFGVLTGIALWRLVRLWAPRRAFLVLVGALAFLLLSGNSMLGNFWLVRIWQGKVIAVAVLMPVIWAYLTELHAMRGDDRRADRLRHVLLLLAAGVTFYGLTPTAVVWAPVMFGAIVLAALALRSKVLVVGGLAMLVGPVLSGLAVVVFSSDVGGEDPVALTAQASFLRVIGDPGLMSALAVVALGAAVLLTRRGVAAALAGASALASVLVYAPGVLDVVNVATGSGPILWRMLYVAPIPVLVGLLFALPAPALGAGRELGQDTPARAAPAPPTPHAGGVAAARPTTPVGQRDGALPSHDVNDPGHRPGPARPALAKVLPAVPALVAVGCLVVGGAPIWSETGHGHGVKLTSTPTWKVDEKSLDDVEKAVADGIEGTVLMPPRRMKVLTMYTTDAFPVVPREWFIQNIREPKADRKARRLLYNLVDSAHPKLAGPDKVRAALERLDVDLACAGPSKRTRAVVDLFLEAGYTDTVRYGTMRCARRPG